MRLLTLLCTALLHATVVLGIQPEVFKETMQGSPVPILDKKFGLKCDSPSTYKPKDIMNIAKKARESSQRGPSFKLPFIHPKYPTLTFYAYPLGHRRFISPGKEVIDYLIFNSKWLAVDGVVISFGEDYGKLKICSFTPGTSFTNIDKSVITISKDEAITSPEAGSLDPPGSGELRATNKSFRKTWNSFRGLEYPVLREILGSNGLDN